MGKEKKKSHRKLLHTLSNMHIKYWLHYSHLFPDLLQEPGSEAQ